MYAFVQISIHGHKNIPADNAADFDSMRAIWRWYGAILTRCCCNRRLQRPEIKNDFGTVLAFGSKYKMIQFHKKIHRFAIQKCRWAMSLQLLQPGEPEGTAKVCYQPRLSFALRRSCLLKRSIATQNKGRLVKVRVWLKQSKRGKDVDASDSRDETGVLPFFWLE